VKSSKPLLQSAAGSLSGAVSFEMVAAMIQSSFLLCTAHLNRFTGLRDAPQLRHALRLLFMDSGSDYFVCIRTQWQMHVHVKFPYRIFRAASKVSH